MSSDTEPKAAPNAEAKAERRRGDAPTYYLIVLSIVAGLLGAVVLGVFVFGQTTYTRLASVGTGSALALAAVWIVKRLPKVSSQQSYRLAALGMALGVLGFVGLYMLFRTGYWFEETQPVVLRLSKLELQIEELRSQLWADAYRTESAGRPANERWWTRVPSRPGARHLLNVEVTGVPDTAVLEVTATDGDGALLIGRLEPGSGSAKFYVDNPDAWSFDVGIRWWEAGDSAPRVVGSSKGRDELSLGVFRLTSVPVHETPARPFARLKLVTTRKGVFTVASGDPIDASTEGSGAFGPTCFHGRAYEVDVDAPAWVRFWAEGTSPGICLHRRASDTVGSLLAFSNRTTAVSGPRVGGARLRTVLDAALPRGRYQVLVAGADGEGEERAFTAGGSSVAIAEVGGGHDAIAIDHRGSTEASVDFLAPDTWLHGCGASHCLYRDLPLRPSVKGTYRAYAVPDPQTARGWDVRRPRAVFLSDLLERRVLTSWLDNAGRQSSDVQAAPLVSIDDLDVPPRLRLAIPEPFGRQVVRVRVERLRDSTAGPLAAACGAAPQIGARWEAATDGRGATNILSVDPDSAVIRIGSDRPGRVGGDAPEQLARLVITEESIVTLGVRTQPDEQAAASDFVVYLLDGCSDQPLLLVANDDDDGVDPGFKARLPPGEYVLVVDGRTSTDHGAFVVQVGQATVVSSELAGE